MPLSLQSHHPLAVFHVAHYFVLRIRIVFQRKFDTVAERVHLFYWVMKEEITHRKIASSLQTLVGINCSDRIRDDCHISLTVITEFVLLISEHLNDRNAVMPSRTHAELLWLRKNRYCYIAAIHYCCSVHHYKRMPGNNFWM